MEISCNLHLASATRRCGTAKPLGLEPGVYDFIYTYPLDKPAMIKHAINQNTSLRDLMMFVRDDYVSIYETEEATAGNPGHIPGMLNRARSAGMYGIWGHDFSDLYLEGISINGKIITLSIGS